MKYNVAFKHLEKIAKNSKGTRNVLQGVHHLDNKVQATDSYRMLIALADKMSFDEHILNPKTQQEIDGQFPDTKQLSKHDHYNGEQIDLSVVDIKAIRDILKVAKTMKFETAVINTTGDNVVLETTVLKSSSNSDEINEALKKTNLSYELSDKVSTEEKNKYLININYLLDIFEFLVDTKSFTTLKLHGRMTPIHFLNDDYDYLVMSIREH